MKREAPLGITTKNNGPKCYKKKPFDLALPLVHRIPAEGVNHGDPPIPQVVCQRHTFTAPTFRHLSGVLQPRLSKITVK